MYPKETYAWEFLENFAHTSDLDGPLQALIAIANNGVMDIFQFLALGLAAAFSLWSLGKLAWRRHKGLYQKGEALFVMGYILLNAAIAVTLIGIPRSFYGMWYYFLFLISQPFSEMSALNGTYIISAITYAAMMYATWVTGITLAACRLAGYPAKEDGLFLQRKRRNAKKRRAEQKRLQEHRPSDAGVSRDDGVPTPPDAPFSYLSSPKNDTMPSAEMGKNPFASTPTS